MDIGAPGHKDASSSQESEMQRDCTKKKLTSELEEAEQAGKDKFDKQVKDKEAREKEAEVNEEEDRSAGGAEGEAKEEGGRRSNSTAESEDNPEGSHDEFLGEADIFSSKKRGNVVAQKRAFKWRAEKAVERRMQAFGLDRRSHDKYDELTGAPTKPRGARRGKHARPAGDPEHHRGTRGTLGGLDPEHHRGTRGTLGGFV